LERNIKLLEELETVLLNTPLLVLPLLAMLALTGKARKYAVTEQGKYVSKRARREYDVIRTRPREPLIYAIICNVLLAKESTIISPWID